MQKKSLYIGFLVLGCFAATLPVFQLLNQYRKGEALLQQLEGDFDNFQQVWQEHTKTGIHRVKTEAFHVNIHTAFRRTTIQGQQALYARHYRDRDTNKVVGAELYLLQKNGMLKVYNLPLNAKPTTLPEQPARIVQWQQLKNGTFELNDGQRRYQLQGDTLMARDLQTGGLLAHSDPHRLLRCRFFTGWIETPHPDYPDSIYRYRNLRLHDQGDKVQLIMPSGQKGEYSVELTQLVYGKQIPIMKLAVYKLPAEQLEYNSFSAAYAWTTPESKRIGINLRYLTSGWTQEKSGLGVSK
jgi:hypothetical protein